MTTVKAEVMESLKGKKFAELKTMALAEGWVEYHNYIESVKERQLKNSFIGVKGMDLMEFIAGMAQQKADIALMDEIDAEEEFLEGKINLEEYKQASGIQPDPQPEPSSDEIITLKMISSHLGITEKSLRRKLRGKGMEKPGGRWEWKAGDTMLNEIMKWKSEEEVPGK